MRGIPETSGIGPWRAIVWCAIALAIAARATFDWTAPLLEQHAFRQSQTAITVYWFLRDGIDLLRPPMPVFGIEARSIPFEFPLYQAIVAAVLDLLGTRSLEAIAAGCRGVSFAFHLLAAWPLHRLTHRHFAPIVADGAVLLWLTLPYAVFWSTTAMIETTAIALTLIHAHQLDRAARAEGAARSAAAVAAMVAGALAATVKVTTFALYLPAAGLLYVAARRIWSPLAWRAADVLIVLGAFAVPIAALLAWTAWADAVKAENAIAGLGLMSAALADWNFGRAAQRFSGEVWRTIAICLVTVVLGFPAAVAVAIGAVRALARFSRAVWISVALLGPLVFINLYYVHDYYFFALLPPLVMLAAFGACTLVAAIGRSQALCAGAILLLAVASWADAIHRWGRWSPTPYPLRRISADAALPPEGALVLEIAARIRAGGYPPGPIVITGNDWSPDIALYAERPAYMLGKSAGHEIGGCSAENWERVRQARPPLFVMVKPGPTVEECWQGRPAPRCTIVDTERYWIGTCMPGVRAPAAQPPS